MSELRSVLDQIAAVADESLTVEELATDIAELSYVGQMVDVLVARKTKQIADRAGHAEMGYPSPTAFLVDHARMSAGHAKQVVGRANASETAPVAFGAWADGRLSTDQTRYVFQLAEAVPDVFSAAEERLVGIIEPLTVRETVKVLEYWRQSVDGPSELDLETELARRGLSVSKTMGGGMRRVDGWLTATAGEALELALDAFMPPPRSDDCRTPRQRRHDALEDLARAWLDHGDTPIIGGEKPHISVIADIPALRGLAGGLHETLNGDILDVHAVRMLACDCSVSRIVMGPSSEVLDIGRKTRVWTAAQRRAIIARDRHCKADGCEARPGWCDIHHLEHWADGGPTGVENGTLFCRFHHTLEHLAEGQARRSRT
jgi:hypothetical protein